jgi:tetratricopeptide (TPR) repeat protein
MSDQESSVHNEFSGEAHGPVVQAAHIDTVVIGSSVPQPVPRQLPMAAAHFVNRHEMLVWLDLVARGAGPRLSAIAGTAGVGKTALVVHWAHQSTARFPDGILYANLRGFDPINPPAEPGEVLDGFLLAMGCWDAAKLADVDARAALFRSAVEGKNMLVVLDDAASPAQVRPLLPGSPLVTVVVTSRNSLSGLTMAEGVTGMSIAPLDDAESVALLREIAGDKLLGVGPAVVTRLVEMCANLPLALRIAAERLNSGSYHGVGELVEELADERDRLDVLATSDRTVTVRAVFTVSYKALDPLAAQVFRLLGLHRGARFGLPAVVALTGLRKARLRLALDVLRAASLLEVDDERYRMHDLLRAYASERAEEDEPADARQRAVRRMLEWYLSSAHAAGMALDPHRRGEPAPPPGGLTFDDRDAALAWCVAEQSNLVAAVRQAADEGEHDIAWRLPAALWTFFFQRKPWDDWVQTHLFGLRSAELSGDDFGAATMLGHLAIAHREQGRQRDAEQCFKRALEIWTRLGERRRQAQVGNGYGNACREWGRLDEAVALSHDALASWRAVGDRHGEGITHNSLSGIHRDREELELALRHSEEALAAFRETGDEYAEVWAMHNAANVHRDLGDVRRSVEMHREVLAARVRLGDNYGQALTLQSLAEGLGLLGEEDARIEALDRALEIFSRLSDPKAEQVRAALRKA